VSPRQKPVHHPADSFFADAPRAEIRHDAPKRNLWRWACNIHRNNVLDVGLTNLAWLAKTFRRPKRQQPCRSFTDLERELLSMREFCLECIFALVERRHRLPPVKLSLVKK
jgi:hypothetical protein